MVKMLVSMFILYYRFSHFLISNWMRLICLVGGTIEVDEARKRRWDGLNAVLDINKKARIKDGHMSVGYSYANWEQVKGFFHLVTGNLQTTTGDGLPQLLLTALHQYLSYATICFGSITEGKRLSVFISSLPLSSLSAHFLMATFKYWRRKRLKVIVFTLTVISSLF